MELSPNSIMDSALVHERRDTGTISAIVVDDSEAIVRLLTDFLELSGINVLGKAGNGKEAVELYKKKRPDIVLLDIMMPKYDGFYALKRIMRIDSNAKILIVTADFSDKSANRLRDIQGIEIMHKPFDFNHVVAAINKLLASKANIAAYERASYFLRPSLP